MYVYSRYFWKQGPAEVDMRTMSEHIPAAEEVSAGAETSLCEGYVATEECPLMQESCDYKTTRFHYEVRRVPGETLGLTCVFESQGRYGRVAEIADSGVVAYTNASRASQEKKVLQVNDLLLCVNGQSVAEEICKGLRDAERLKMSVCRAEEWDPQKGEDVSSQGSTESPSSGSTRTSGSSSDFDPSLWPLDPIEETGESDGSEHEVWEAMGRVHSNPEPPPAVSAGPRSAALAWLNEDRVEEVW